MTTNRLDDLKEIVPEIQTVRTRGNAAEVEMMDPEMESNLIEFNKKADSIEADMKNVADVIKQIKDLHVKAISATVASERKDIKDDLNKHITSAGMRNKAIQQELERLNNGTLERKKQLDGKNTAEIRIRELKHVALVKEFQKVITDYQEMQAEYRKLYSDRAKRTCKITNPKLTDEEVEEMIENKQIDEDAYKKKILTKSQQGTMDAYFDEAVETRRDVLMLEGSLIELQEMFVAMAQLVAQQDDLIDNIENNVINADEYVKKAIEYTQAAKGHAEKSRVITIVILLIIVIALVVFGVVATGITVPVVLKLIGTF